MTRPFTVTMAIRGTLREMESAPLALHSVSALGPAQLLVGLDEDAPPSLERMVRGNVACRLDIIRVPRDPAWTAHFPHVTWDLITGAANDLILCTDADLILSKDILKDTGRPGTSNIAATTFSVRPAGPGLSNAWRRMVFPARWRLRRRLRGRKAFTGLYFIWRPFYMDLVQKDAMMSLRNGVDSLLWRAITRSKKYAHHFSGMVGASGLDDTTVNYPFYQFANGIKLAATKSPLCAAPYCAYHAAMYAHPWYAYGYLWALAHPRHEVVRECAAAGEGDFDRRVIPMVVAMRDWAPSMAQRTGFAV